MARACPTAAIPALALEASKSIPGPAVPRVIEYSAISPPQFDHSSYTPPDQQASCIQSITGSLNLQIGMGQVGFGKIGGRLRLYSLPPIGKPAQPQCSSSSTRPKVTKPSVMRTVAACCNMSAPPPSSTIVNDTGGNGYWLKFYHREREAKREGRIGAV